MDRKRIFICTERPFRLLRQATACRRLCPEMLPTCCRHAVGLQSKCSRIAAYVQSKCSPFAVDMQSSYRASPFCVLSIRLLVRSIHYVRCVLQFRSVLLSGSMPWHGSATRDL